MGIPAFPRAAKSLPMSVSIASFFRSLCGSSRPSGSRPRIPQFQLYKPRSRRRRSLWEISDLESHDLVSMRNSDGADNTISHARVELVTTGGTNPNQLQTV